MTLGAARVIWSINDLSMFVDEMVRGYVTMFLKTERGPVATAKVISTPEEYSRIFGKKVSWTNDPLVAEICLKLGGRLNVIRLAHYTDIEDPTTITATNAAVSIYDNGNIPIPGYITSSDGPFYFTQRLSGRTQGTELGPFTFDTDSTDMVSFSVNDGTAQDVQLDGTMTTTAVAAAINAGTEGLTAHAEFDNNSGGYFLKVYANEVTDSLQVLTVDNDAYTILGLVVGDYDYTEGTDSLVVSIDGEADQTFTITPPAEEEGDFHLTAGQIVTRLAALTDAVASAYDGQVTITSDTTGLYSSVQIQATSTAAEALGFDTEPHAGYSGDPDTTLQIKALTPGEWGNDLTVQISQSSLHPELFFNMKITYARQREMDEHFAEVSMDPDSDRYVVNFVKERSFLIEAVDLLSENPAPADIPTPGTYALVDGDDGGTVTEADMIGYAAAQTGIYAADLSYMSMDLMIPGTTSATVYRELIAYCENRGDMIGYGQVPAGNDPEDAVNWRLGDGGYTHPAFNSHRFALFFGRPLVYDSRDSSKKYITCLGHLAACLCRTDNDYGYHYAPVGPRRGAVGLVEGIDFNIQDYRSTGYADLFAENGINYLMISHMPGLEGAMFWEQRTTQRLPSALRELNVIRFITMVNRSLMPILRAFLFEPNHPVTWREIHRVLQPAFEEWKTRYAIYDYVIQTDRDAFFDGGELKNAVLNSGLDIDRGIYHCRALIQPTRAIYYLEFTLGVLRTGEAFENYTSLKTLPGWVRH